MTWEDAINQAMSSARGKFGASRAGVPRLSNQAASGLILFAREAAGAVPFDWYAFALPALGYAQLGDQFDMGIPHQLDQYANAPELWIALLHLAQALDAAHVPFKLVRDPTGTEKTYKQLASDAWKTMQAESPAAAQASVDASKQKATQIVTDADENGVRHVFDVDADGNVDAGTVYGKRKPKPKPKDGSGAGGGILLLLLAIALAED